jgi:hypothetical protein
MSSFERESLFLYQNPIWNITPKDFAGQIQPERLLTGT